MKKTQIAVVCVFGALLILLACNGQSKEIGNSPAQSFAGDTRVSTSSDSSGKAEPLAPAWSGTFTYLGMRTGMTKQEALEELGKFRDMNLACRTVPSTPKSEFCDGSENELSLLLTFDHGRLRSISGEDKYSPFGAFSAPFLLRFGTPDVHTDSEIKWSAGTQTVEGRTSPLETCKISLRRGNVHIDIVRWGKVAD